MQNVEPESPFQALEMQSSQNPKNSNFNAFVFYADQVNTAGYTLTITSLEREKQLARYVIYLAAILACT